MINSKRYGSRIQLYHLKNGDVAYYVVMKINGKTIRKKIGKKSEGITEAKALERRNALLSEARHGVDISGGGYRNKMTLNDVADKYFIHGSVHLRSNKHSMLMYGKHIKSVFGDSQIMKLSDSDIISLQAQKRGEGLSDSTINSIIKLVQRIIGHAVKAGYIDFSPLKNIKQFKLNNGRIRYLTLNEIDSLLNIIQNDLEVLSFVKLSLSVGARAESILMTKCIDVDINTQSIVLFDFKRNMTYHGYFTKDVSESISNMIEGLKPSDYIVGRGSVPVKYQSIYRKMKKYLYVFNDGLHQNDARNRVVIHTLRHTFASHLAIAGTPLHVIQKLLNHSNITMTSKYAHLSPDSGSNHVKRLYNENNHL